MFGKIRVSPFFLAISVISFGAAIWASILAYAYETEAQGLHPLLAAAVVLACFYMSVFSARRI